MTALEDDDLQPVIVGRMEDSVPFAQTRGAQVPGSVRADPAWCVATVRAAKAVPCADCLLRFPTYVMQLDHVPERGPKLFNVRGSARGMGQTEAAILAELAKTDAVCANCHAQRTASRAGYSERPR